MKRLLGVLLLGLFPAAPVFAAELTVAAAPSSREALEELAATFQQDTGHQVKFVFASSGKLFIQLRNGSPCDLFFSADDVYPARLHAEGLAEKPRRYAQGRLVLWASKASGFAVERGLDLLGDAKVRKVAIANPKLAPYGRAAEEALKANGTYQALASKLVLGENVSQAAHFTASGAADLGVLPLSLALTPELSQKGRYVLVPASLHTAIAADAAVMTAAPDKALARQFLAFATSERARPVWQRNGLAAK
ncbi:molybdate ABC transporter substrate-binding protein [bacterium]|nr:molybdate ABC transporter substrate-binding protein [bacterium]